MRYLGIALLLCGLLVFSSIQGNAEETQKNAEETQKNDKASFSNAYSLDGFLSLTFEGTIQNYQLSALKEAVKLALENGLKVEINAHLSHVIVTPQKLFVTGRRLCGFFQFVVYDRRDELNASILARGSGYACKDDGIW